MPLSATSRPRRVVLVTFGTRGDVLPFCVLGRELEQRGHEVRFVTASDYHDNLARFGLDPVDTGEGFDAILREPEFEPLFHDYFSAGFTSVRALRSLMRRMETRLVELMGITCDEIRRGDLVVYNPFAYFAGAFANELGRPAVRVMCQPLLPSRNEPISMFGRRGLGRLGNRLSYEVFRGVSPMIRRAVSEVRRRHGLGRRLGVFANPLTVSLRDVHHLAAFSPALSPDPGDWPVPVTMTGAWFALPEPDAMLRPDIEAFLMDGPPPIYVGFGSMLWGAKRNTEVVLRALEIWGGRAVVSEGTGGMRLPNWASLPKNLIATTHAEHALLFPRVAAVVHHGGAGTTAAALRAGRPSVILPLLGDQLYWGRRVAALGAGEAPIPLRRVTPEDLARRIAQATSDPAMRAAAAAAARAMADEPGVAAAADHIEGLLAQARDDKRSAASSPP